MNAEASPLDERISSLIEIKKSIEAIRLRLGGLPAAYHADVAAELRAVADGLDQAEKVRVQQAGRPHPSEQVRQVVASIRKASASKPSRKPKPNASEKTLRARLWDYFKSRDNEWATIAEISDALGVPTTGVGTILYRRNDGEFEKGEKRETGKAPARLWRLSPESFNPIATALDQLVS
jgi:hypothetical protein